MKNIRLFLPILSLALTIILNGCEKENIVTEYDDDPIENLHSLWKILDERYCYFTAKNIDWDGVYDIYYNKLMSYKSITIYEYFDLLAAMLDTLQDGHVNLYSPFDISVCSGWYDRYPTDYYPEIINSDRYTPTLRRAGGFSYEYISNSNIGYIRYGSFSNGFSTANCMYINNYFRNAKGLIIDVRHNGGGSLENSHKLASCFFKEKTITGYIHHKTGPGHDEFSELEPIYTDPDSAPVDWSQLTVVVLSNRQCYSATNDFIVRMKQAPNVTVIGGITGGGGGMPLSQELPNGWMIRFSAIPMFDAEKNHTEFGVEPDKEIHITDVDIKNGNDPIIDEAIKLINEKAIQLPL